MSTKVFNSLVAFLDKLEQQKIGYTLAHNREEAIMVLVAVPGERWEVEFMGDGSAEAGTLDHNSAKLTTIAITNL